MEILELENIANIRNSLDGDDRINKIEGPAIKIRKCLI